MTKSEICVDLRLEHTPQHLGSSFMSNQKAFRFVLIALFAVGLSGCGSSSGGSSQGESMDAAVRAIDAQKAEERQQKEDAAAVKLAAEKKAEAERKAAEDKAAKAQAASMHKVGDRPAVAPGGYYSAIIGARRHILNVVDSLSWIQGVRNFKAEKGRKPKDTAEFMKDCVGAYQLDLPRLEPGQEYLYDPNGQTDGDFGQLYVVEQQSAPSSVPAPPGAPAPK
ncbi:MAG TPA: hypothetical protein VHE81_00690 [Lacipirellulaceae bacterium]|nr:hypothetical protein [Lacipirellulaceae bacterium]